MFTTGEVGPVAYGKSVTYELAFATIETGAIDVLQKLNCAEGLMHTDDQLCSHL